METRIPQSVADQLYFESGKLDGVGPAYHSDGDLLGLINQTMDGIPVMPECARSVSLRPILLGPSFIPARTS